MKELFEFMKEQHVPNAVRFIIVGMNGTNELCLVHV